jgi:hypothetical protein
VTPPESLSLALLTRDYEKFVTRMCVTTTSVTPNVTHPPHVGVTLELARRHKGLTKSSRRGLLGLIQVRHLLSHRRIWASLPFRARTPEPTPIHGPPLKLDRPFPAGPRPKAPASGRAWRVREAQAP